jgi:hypothetical protein
MMNIVKTDIKNMQDIAPLIDDDIIEVYNAKYRKYKRVKKPNFVNGLTEVKVNPHNNEHEYEFASRQGSREASPSNNQNDASSQDAPLQPPAEIMSIDQDQDQDQQQRDVDNKSIDPVEPTIVPIVNNQPSPSVRKSPSLSVPIQPTAPIIDNTQLMLMYQQLQAQAAAQAQAQAAAQAAAQAQAQASAVAPPANSQSPPHAAANTVPSVSPAHSIRSNSSIPLGQIQTDNNGNQIVNT